MDTCFFLVDIDAFFASVEQARDPALRGRPVIVGSGVIASCSYEARPFGLHAGMPIRTAERLCPQGVYLDGDHTAYARISDRIEKICGDCTPGVARVSIDEFFLDLGGCDRIYPDLMARALRLARDIEADAGVPVSIGIAENRLLAKMAASYGKPRGITRILPGCGPAFIAPMALDRLHGVGRARRAVFDRMNIRTIGDVRRLPPASLRSMFGANGTYLAETCQGREAGLPDYGGAPKSISRETTFHADTADRGHISAMLWYLVERAGRALREGGRECRTVEVRIRYSDFKTVSRRTTLTAHSCRDAELFRAAEPMLHALYTRRTTLRYVGVTLSSFRPAAAGTQLLLFEPEPPPYHLYEAVDRVRAKYGHAALAGGRSVMLIDKVPRNRDRGFTLRTPSLTQ